MPPRLPLSLRAKTLLSLALASFLLSGCSISATRGWPADARPPLEDVAARV